MLHATPALAALVGLSLAASEPPHAPTPAATAVVDEALAAQAPVPAWLPEGGADAHTSDVDPREATRKIRRTAVTGLSGGILGLLGLVGLMGGYVMILQPNNKLKKLKEQHGGVLPTDDPGRQRAIMTAKAAPYMLGASAAMVLVGATMTLISARRLKKLREERRTQVAFGAMPAWGGASFSAEVRF